MSSFDKYVDIFLGDIIRIKKNNNSRIKPFIFIRGAQNKILESSSISRDELIKYCNVCFISESENQLDKSLNTQIDVKIYSEESKKLSISRKSLKTRLNDYSIAKI